MAKKIDLLDGSNAEKYRYHQQLRLGGIRLIRIEPDSEASKIRCSFVNKSLIDTTINYNALSYVWGNQSNKVTICCSGKNFNIT